MKSAKAGSKLGPPVSRAFVMPEVRALAGVIRRERERRKLSLNRLAQQAGISRQMLGFVEADVCIPTIETLARIARALGISGGGLLLAAERWLARLPAQCRACKYACMARGRLKWWNPRRGCLRPAR